MSKHGSNYNEHSEGAGDYLRRTLHDEEAMLEVAKKATEDQREAMSEVEGLVEEFAKIMTGRYYYAHDGTKQDAQDWLRTALTTYGDAREAAARAEAFDQGVDYASQLEHTGESRIVPPPGSDFAPNDYPANN